MDRLDRLSRLMKDYIALGVPKTSRPTGIKPKPLQRAAALRAEPTLPPPSIVAPEGSQDAPEPSTQGSGEATGTFIPVPQPEPAEPELPKDPSRQIPCCFVLSGGARSNYREAAVYCSKLSTRAYCELHWAEVFDHPANKAFNGRLHRQR